MRKGSEDKLMMLTSKGEVPPNDSRATGMAWFELQRAGLEVNVMDIDMITAAHIHL